MQTLILEDVVHQFLIGAEPGMIKALSISTGPLLDLSGSCSRKVKDRARVSVGQRLEEASQEEPPLEAVDPARLERSASRNRPWSKHHLSAWVSASVLVNHATACSASMSYLEATALDQYVCYSNCLNSML